LPEEYSADETGVRDMEVTITTVSEQTMNNLSVQVRKGALSGLPSRQRRLSSRRVFVADSKDMPARKRALPPGRPLHAS